MTWVHDFWHDLLFGLRMLRKNRGFAVVASASLALGIGANTAVLGVMNELLGGGLPFPHSDRLVNIREFPLDNPQRSTNASVPDYFAWQDRTRAFDVMGASLPEQKDLGVETGGQAERLSGQGFTPSVLFGRWASSRSAGRSPTPNRRSWQGGAGGRDQPFIVAAALRRRSQRHQHTRPAEWRDDDGHRRHAAGIPVSERQRGLLTPLPLNEAQLQGSACFSS